MRYPLPRSGAGPVRRAAATLLCGLVVATTSACTGEDSGGAPDDASSSPTTEASATITARPAPAVIRVTRVAGRLGPASRKVLAGKVGAVVSSYLQDAFLGGDYPRTDFDGAFSSFTRGAAARAARQRDLLTNAALGPTTEAVVARRQTAYLSVLAPNRVAAGVSALVHLRFVAERGDEPDKVVTVKGRLMLTRRNNGGWTIFGYDLTKSVTTAGGGS